MNNKVMSGKTAKALVIFSALFLILLGVGLYKLFEYQGYDKKETNKFINYNVKDYIETTPIIFSVNVNLFCRFLVKIFVGFW